MNQSLAFEPVTPEAAHPNRSNAALARAEDAVARLDERLATSPIATAFSTRANVHDAAAALFLEGELVLLEDLVLHDAAADIRAPTHALTRAHVALRVRRRICAVAPGAALLDEKSLEALRGHAPHADGFGAPRGHAPGDADPIAAEEDAFAAELASMDALIARSRRVLDERATQQASDPAADPVTDPMADVCRNPAGYASPGHAPGPPSPLRKDRLADWRTRLHATRTETPIMAAAVAGAALDTLAPFPHQAWLGRLLIADLLRAREKTRHHLLAINLGLKLVTREGRLRQTDRTALWIAAITAAAEHGLREHDRLLNANRSLERKLAGRRSTSNLPALVTLVMSSPVVSSQTIATALKITPRAAQDLVAALGLRELTGRTRYRCWGIL